MKSASMTRGKVWGAKAVRLSHPARWGVCAEGLPRDAAARRVGG